MTVTSPTIRTVVAAALALVLAPGAASAAPSLVQIGGQSFARPVHMASPPEDPRVFVVEQDGVVRIVDADGTTRSQPFLDIGDEVAGSDSHNERGLLSIAFAPDYTASGLFYVYLTAQSPLGEVQIREYRRSATDAHRAEASSFRFVLRQAHADNGNHNGGGMAFGPDGRLWAGIGDGGSRNDPQRNGQKMTTLLGKLVRVDPAGPIPSDNPFASSGAGERPEIWAYGLRNPWRFSFDRQTGDLIIGDVGQDLREEIDFAPASMNRRPGANYGWVCFEGTMVNAAAPAGCQAPGHVPPVHELRHEQDGVSSITGGFVVRDPGLPTLAGRYLYGDISLPRLRSVALSASGASGDREEATLAVEIPSSFGEDACGRVLVAALLAGKVFRVTDGVPTACAKTIPALPAPGAAPGSGSGPGTEPAGGAPPCVPALTAPARRSARSILRSGLRLTVRRDRSCTVKLSARIARAGSFQARRLPAGARSTVLRLRVSRATARALRRGRRGTVRLRATARSAAGTFVATASVRLR